MFFYPRQAILQPIGLVTDPNEYGQYPSGALQVARNVTLRLPGKLIQAPQAMVQETLGAADSIIRKLMPADTGNCVYSIVDDGVGNFSIFRFGAPQTFVGSAVDAFSDTGRISWAECNERVIVNGNFGNLVRDPDPISTDFRAAGLPQPQIALLSLNINVPPDGWLEPDHAVQYRVCLVRRYEHDYTLRSVPSPVWRINGQANDATVDVRIEWPSGAGIEEGDILEIYRTNILATTSIHADTGDTYRLVQEHILTAADILAGFVVLEDTQPPVFGTLVTAGRELYTNPGVEGENYVNLRPPIAKVIVSFKGFCFYGHTTERAKFTFQIPGGWGDTVFAIDADVPEAYAREHGIGIRAGTGLTAVGSPTVTGVSAAEMVGVVVGQRNMGPAFTLNARVIAVGVNTITMDENAASVETDWELEDVIELDGIIYGMGYPAKFLNELEGRMEVQYNQAITTRGVYHTSFEMSLLWNRHPFTHPIFVRATNGQNYSPQLPLLSQTQKQIDPETRKNRLVWTKEQQPEHQPSVSEDFVGFGELYAANATRDCIWLWCSDGLFRLSGNGGSLGLGAWQIDYANASLLLCAPQASTAMGDKCYGYTNEGVVELDSAGNISHKTRDIISKLLPGPRYVERPGIIMERNEVDDEILLCDGLDDNGWSNSVFIYNTRQKGWTRLEDNGDELSGISAIGMFRLPPSDNDAHVLFANAFPGSLATYCSWNLDTGLDGTVLYQPVYGEDPLEVKRWMWADYLFGPGTTGQITTLWNSVGFGPNFCTMQALDAGVYARAGVPRQVGLSQSLAPGFQWGDDNFPLRVFEGLSLAVKQRTNQSKKR